MHNYSKTTPYICYLGCFTVTFRETVTHTVRSVPKSLSHLSPESTVCCLNCQVSYYFLHFNTAPSILFVKNTITLTQGSKGTRSQTTFLAMGQCPAWMSENQMLWPTACRQGHIQRCWETQISLLYQTVSVSLGNKGACKKIQNKHFFRDPSKYNDNLAITRSDSKPEVY